MTDLLYYKFPILQQDQFFEQFGGLPRIPAYLDFPAKRFHS